MVRRLLYVVLLFTGAQTASAQIIDAGGSGRRFGQANAWASLGIGWLQQGGLCDPGSDSCWDFGNAPQWRASVARSAQTPVHSVRPAAQPHAEAAQT